MVSIFRNFGKTPSLEEGAEEDFVKERPATSAVDSDRTTYSDKEDEAERAHTAADVLGSLLGAPDQEIPTDLLEKAHAVAVIPHVAKGASLVGGKYVERG